MTEPIKIVIVDDRLALSIARDVFSIASLLAAVGMGVWLESNALQWVAGILWVLVIIGKGTRLKDGKCTIAEARKKLDELEQE